MWHFYILTLSLTATINCLQHQVENKNDGYDLKPLLSIIQRSLDQVASQQQQREVITEPEQKLPARQPEKEEQQQPESKKTLVDGGNQQPLISARQQQLYQPQYAPVAFIEPQFPYPGFAYVQGKQPIPRGQPQLVLYGPGQGQPILINPGSPPPGNFLVPHQPQPGPNFILRDQGPVFLAGYPKPAHIPPIEKDAEEIPTNPSKVPPLPTVHSKPEKLETFNEDNNEIPNNSASETDVSAQADRIPQPFPKTTNLKPGQRFFILNGEPLFQNYELHNYLGEANLLPTKQQLDVQYNTYPFSALPLRTEIPKDAQGRFINPNVKSNVGTANSPKAEDDKVRNEEQSSRGVPQQVQQQQIPFNNFQFTGTPLNFHDGPFFIQSQNIPAPQPQIVNQEQQPSTKDRIVVPEEQHLQPLGLHGPQFSQESLFNVNLPLRFDGGERSFGELGQFRFTPPSESYFPIDGENIENDSIVVNADLDDVTPEPNSGNAETPAQSEKSSDPSTAQASPGAIALAGPGGVAGAAPKATALAGKGGLAVSSPQATAVAGTQKERENKKPTSKAKTK